MKGVYKVAGGWLARVRKKGHPQQSRVFKSKILAEQWKRKLETGIEAGAVHGQADAVTVGALVDRYKTEVGGARPFGRNKAWVLEAIKHHLGSEPAATLTPERLVDYIRKDRAVANVTAAIDLSYLKGVLKIARALWRNQVHPSVVDDAREILRHMGMAQRSEERDRRPTIDELDRVRVQLARSRSLTPDLMDFILDSCFRPPSEIVRLRWADLNEVDRTIVIRDRKDPRKKLGNHQTVPLLGRCMEIILRQPRTGELIFPVNGKSWSSLWPRACRAAGVEGLHLYDLRHEAISRLMESGRYSIPEACLITGHKDPKQLMRYTQLRAKNLHR
jgi:integrase